MSETRVDRRVGRTRRLLKEALLELIRERGYEKISVRDITERADVGRSTFYSHFTSKEDLLFDGFDRWLLSRAEAPDHEGSDAGTERFRFSLPFLTHIGHQRRFFQAIMGSAAGARIRRKTLALLSEMIRRELGRMSGTSLDARLPEAQVQYLVGAFMGLTSWWVDDSCRLPVEAVDRTFQTLTLEGVKKG